MNEYSPLMFYLFTLVVCLGILLKTFKGVCKDEDMESSNLDFHGAPLITPEVFIINNTRPQYSINLNDDQPPSYDSISSPPSYEETFKDVKSVQVSSLCHV
ncbi:hypothetical protein ACKWTF_013400 [Chironomus riparius]